MPNIEIRETDKTTAYTSVATNFSVLIPGFVGESFSEDTSPFDANGVYECSAAVDFKNKIGYAGPHTVASAGVGPTLATPASIYQDQRIGMETLHQFEDTGCWYTRRVHSGSVGRLHDETYKYTQYVGADGSKNPVTTWGKTGSTVKTYYTKNSLGEFEAVNTDTTVPSYAIATGNGYFLKVGEGEGEDSYERITNLDGEFKTADKYFGIQLGFEGKDAVQGYHYGNQIAYELLNMGYTILFKRLNYISDLEDDSWWDCLTDKSEYDFRYVLSGCISLAAVADIDAEPATINSLMASIDNKMITICETRGDCIALCDLDSKLYANKSQGVATQNINAGAKEVRSSKYAMIIAPAVHYGGLTNVDKFDGNTYFPATVHYLACAARSHEAFAEWYANAGYTRGISNYSITSADCVFGETAVNELSPRTTGVVDKAINLIARFKNVYYIWGNRTSCALTENGLIASHFLNIRELCCTLKKKIYDACRRFTFDPNSDLLWINFCNYLRSTLDNMKADQGIADYKLVKSKQVERGKLVAKVRIVPIEAVEDFDITVTLEDSLSGTDVTLSEVND